MMWSIRTSAIRGTKSWEYMLGGFNSPREAMEWLVTTYQANADFWAALTGVKITKE